MVRFFSGLKSSLECGVWDPQGVPTIYKVMESLDKSKFEWSLYFQIIIYFF